MAMAKRTTATPATPAKRSNSHITGMKHGYAATKAVDPMGRNYVGGTWRGVREYFNDAAERAIDIDADINEFRKQRRA
jgi:hypothetical protein